MKIVHVTGYFGENLAYQENLLPVGQVKLGHEVIVITGKNEPDFKFNRETRKKEPGEFNYKGVRVIRIHHYFEFHNKGPILKGLFPLIIKLKPDILFIHDVGSSFITGLLYKLLNPKVRLQVDCHSFDGNARGSFLGPLFHGLFKLLFILFKKKFDKIFSTAPETTEFMIKYYGLKENDIKLLPLPGDASNLENRKEIGIKVRKEINVDSSIKILIHTGKLPREKQTLKVLEMFQYIQDRNIILLIAGDIDKDFQPVFKQFLEKESRIKYLGWVSPDRIRELFMASDLFVQVGGLSNTFVDAVCSGLPLLLNDTPQGRFLTSWNNGIVLNEPAPKEIAEKVVHLFEKNEIERMKENSIQAGIYLDYKNNAVISLEHIIKEEC